LQLVHEDVLVSAAHCAGKLGRRWDDGNLFSSHNFVLTICFLPSAGLFFGKEMILGGNILSGRDANEIILADTERVHPLANSWTLENDVLLIKLSQPSSASPLEYNADFAIPADHDTVKTIGFGFLTENGPPSEELMEVEVNVVPFAKCNAASPWEVYDDTMVRFQRSRKEPQFLSFGQVLN